MELNKNGKVIRTHPKVKTAAAYQQLTRRITTGADTAQIETVIHSPYQEGHVTYDDCSLVEEKP